MVRFASHVELEESLLEYPPYEDYDVGLMEDPVIDPNAFVKVCVGKE